MSILTDIEITDRVLNCIHPMITPFKQVQARTDGNGRKIISYGLSSFGYDVRLANHFKVFTNINTTIIDPKKIDTDCLSDLESRLDDDGSEYVIMPPNSYMLGHTVETFDIPDDIMVIAVGKSTYARAAMHSNITPIEAGFKGTVVIEMSNASNVPLKVYVNEGISQFIFFKGDTSCNISYADRNGKYQNQKGLQLPLM